MGRRLLAFAAGMLGFGLCQGDQLRLADGGRLTGTVASMDKDGTLTIEADVALDPIKVRPEKIHRIDFTDTAPEQFDHDARIKLVNGDILPCDILSIGSEQVRVRTAFSGELTIPRNVVERMQLGIRPHRVILSGLGDESKWSAPGDKWSVEDGSLVSSDTGLVGRKFDELPPSFSLSFDLEWDQRPTFKVFFCSVPDQGTGGNLDRYYLQFNTAGFELKRQSTGQTSHHPLGVVNRFPADFEDRKFNLEIRVDRPAGMIHLYIDGELEGKFPDLLDDVPEASGIAFESGTKGERSHVVSNIELRHWNASGARHQDEDRGDEDSDAVIDHDGQRFGGALLETATRKGKTVVLFQSPHLEEALQIPMNRISTIFLTGNADDSDPSPLFFGLAGEGELSAASGRFDGRSLFLVHSLLGDMKIRRSALTSMDHRDVKTRNPGNTSDEP